MLTRVWDGVVSTIAGAWDEFVMFYYSNFVRNNLLFLVLYIVIVIVAKATYQLH